MKRVMLPLLLGILMACYVSTAGAQSQGSGSTLSDAPRSFNRASVFGGYSYLRDRTGNANLNGGEAAFSFNLTRHLAIAGDFANYTATYNARRTTFMPYMAGIQIESGRRRVSVFGQGEVGALRLSVADSVESTSQTAIAAEAGGGLDLNLTPHFALRLVQADYLFSHLGGMAQNNLRASSGLVFRF